MFKNIVKNLISPELIEGSREIIFFSFRSHNNEYIWGKNPITSDVFVVFPVNNFLQNFCHASCKIYKRHLDWWGFRTKGRLMYTALSCTSKW